MNIYYLFKNIFEKKNWQLFLRKKKWRLNFLATFPVSSSAFNPLELDVDSMLPINELLVFFRSVFVVVGILGLANFCIAILLFLMAAGDDSRVTQAKTLGVKAVLAMSGSILGVIVFVYAQRILSSGSNFLANAFLLP